MRIKSAHGRRFKFIFFVQTFLIVGLVSLIVLLLQHPQQSSVLTVSPPFNSTAESNSLPNATLPTTLSKQVTLNEYSRA
jgi:hypothetical protein